MTAARAAVKRGRRPGVPIHLRRAVDAALLDALAIRADAPGWKQPSTRQLARHVVRVLGRLGCDVGVGTVLNCYIYGPRLDPMRDTAADKIRHTEALPPDPNIGTSSLLIRFAADMLNFDGAYDARREELIRDIHRWCVSCTTLKLSWPHTAAELALAYREANGLDRR